MRQRLHVSAYYCFIMKERLHRAPVKIHDLLYTLVYPQGLDILMMSLELISTQAKYCYSGLINNNRLLSVCKKWKS